MIFFFLLQCYVWKLLFIQNIHNFLFWAFNSLLKYEINLVHVLKLADRGKRLVSEYCCVCEILKLFWLYLKFSAINFNFSIDLSCNETTFLSLDLSKVVEIVCKPINLIILKKIFTWHCVQGKWKWRYVSPLPYSSFVAEKVCWHTICMYNYLWFNSYKHISETSKTFPYAVRDCNFNCMYHCIWFEWINPSSGATLISPEVPTSVNGENRRGLRRWRCLYMYVIRWQKH